MANRKGTAAPSPLALALAGALSLAVAMGIGRFAFTPLLPLMIRDGQLDVAAGGWLAAANYAGYLIGGLTVSLLPIGSGRLAALALIATAALTAAMAVPGPLAWWMGLRLAAGICSAWAFVGTSVWSLAALADSPRPSWGSSIYCGVGAGVAITGLYCLAGSIEGAAAASLWLQLGALALILFVPVAVVLRRNAARPAAAAAPAKAGSARGTAGLVICYAALGFGYILPATFLPVLAREVVDDPRWFGLAWPLFGATAVLSILFAGRLLRHASRLQVWSAAHLLMGIGVLLPSLWLGGASIALSALLVGGTFMVVTMAGVQEIRERALGDATRMVGRMTTAFAVGQIAGPVVSSLLLRVPALADRGLNLALQLGAASLFASAVWLWRESQATSMKKEPTHAG
jgi:MFS family permease